jgi:carbamoylphosphate synthase large subunit
MPDQIIIDDINSFNLDEYSEYTPGVIKPIKGFMGSGVEIIRSTEDLERYKKIFSRFIFKNPDYKFVLQKYAPGPYEAGVTVFYDRTTMKHKIISLGMREPNKVSETLGNEINNFHPLNCRVADCKPSDELITKEMNNRFEQICSYIPGMYYARFDVRFPNI